MVREGRKILGGKPASRRPLPPPPVPSIPCIWSRDKSGRSLAWAHLPPSRQPKAPQRTPANACLLRRSFKVFPATHACQVLPATHAC